MNEPTIPAPTPPAPAAGSETWPIVLEFARAMECKLAQNRHKGDRAGWMACDPDWLLARLVDEVLELSSAIRSGDLQSVLGEAADVANFTMMIADRVEALPTTKTDRRRPMNEPTIPASTPPAPGAGSEVRVGDRVSVPRLANPLRIWWVTVVEVSPCGRFAKVKGTACFGGIRWVGVSEIREGLKPRRNSSNTNQSGGN